MLSCLIRAEPDLIDQFIIDIGLGVKTGIVHMDDLSKQVSFERSPASPTWSILNNYGTMR